MIFITILTLLAVLAFQQVDHTPIEPKVIAVNLKPEVKTVPSKHSFSAPFRGIGYEISGRVYETNQGLLDSQIHNKSFYKKSKSCSFYNAKLQLESTNSKTYSDNLNIQNSVVSPLAKAAFLIINNDNYLIDQSSVSRVLVAYQFSDDAFSQNPLNISIKDLGLNDSKEVDISLLIVNNVLLITDGVKFVGVDVKNISNNWKITLNSTNKTTNVDYQFAKSNSIVQFELCHIDDDKAMIKIVAVWDKVIKIYHFALDLKSASLFQEINPPTGKLYTSAIVDHNIYALIKGQLAAYRYNKNSTLQTDYVDLESSQCWGMNKYESTLHMICKEGGINYVAEFYFNEAFVLSKDALKLNRYYTEINDANLIFKFGTWENPKLMISGDQDLLLTAYGINRQVLLDSNSRQTTNLYKSLGIEDITTVASLSNLTSTFAVGVGTDFIVFFRINQIPSSIECTLQRKENMVRWNILAEVNTSSCFANGEVEQLESICQYSIPFTYYVSLFEVDSSKELTVNIFVYVVLIACGLLLLGCAFHCKSIRARALKEVQKKIESLKKKKNIKPI